MKLILHNTSFKLQLTIQILNLFNSFNFSKNATARHSCNQQH